MSQTPSSSANQTKMLFATKLDNETYPPWKDYYLNYNNLKKLLKEGVILQNNWSDKDELNFVEALDLDLEKVYGFQLKKFDELNYQLNLLQKKTESTDKFDVDQFTIELDELLSQAQELEHFQRINYTGFTKIVKKHDRLHSNYSVKPLLNVRLKNLPFHSEDYSPLVYKIGTLFQFLRENYNVNESLTKLSSFNDPSVGEFQSFKFWVHPDNLMEVKTTILRHLPVLIYNKRNSDDDDDDDDDDEEGDSSATPTTNDQTINCLYFDNDHFELYNNKLTKINNSSTLRIKWIGKLKDKPKITMEKKQFDQNANFSVEDKIELRQKYINQYIIDKKIPQKLIKINDLKQVEDIEDFIKEFNLQPILRSIYKRTAFQIPGDDKVRIVIDSDISFIREDSFDSQLPIRDPQQWHRLDIDSENSKPLQYLRKGEFSKFPYSTMEIKIKKSSVKNLKNLQWINELIYSSNLIKEIPNFSKFIQGAAALFVEDDKLDNIPLWFNELENDLSFKPENMVKQRSKKTNIDIDTNLSIEDNLSKFKSMVSNTNNFQPRSSSFSGSLLLDIPGSSSKDRPSKIDEVDEDELDEIAAEQQQLLQQSQTADESSSDEEDDEDEEDDNRNPFSKIFSLPSQFSKLMDVDSEVEEVELPAGVVKPESWIKNAGPIKVEAKVWLANERTFNRWLHVTTLLSSLTFIIYNSAQHSNFADISTYMAYFYFGLTIFSGLWGYYIFMKRRNIILERGAKHLDDVVGPLVVAFGLIFALIVNFIFGWRSIDVGADDSAFFIKNQFHKTVQQYIKSIV